jgi:BolA protein
MNSSESFTKIRDQLDKILAPSHLILEDESAQHAGHAGASLGSHYHVIIASPAFADCSLIECHRKIYAALAPLTNYGIHALRITVKKTH